MADVSESVPEMTEAERLEFNRRVDIALAAVPIAAGLFETRKELKEVLSAIEKRRKGPWYAAVFVLGLVLNYWLSDPANKYTWGLLFTLGASLYWVANEVEAHYFRTKHDRCNERLRELEFAWASATGGEHFWSIETLEVLNKIDWDDEAFCAWWAGPRASIVWRVCGYGKGSLISEAMDRQDAQVHDRKTRSARD